MTRTWLLSLIIVAAATVECHAQVILDQDNIPASFNFGQVYSTSSSFTIPLGQEFVPTLNALNFIDLYVDDAGSSIGPGADFLVRIRTGSISGSILGTSLMTFVPDGTNTGGGNILTRFNFTTPVPLTPGSQYVWQIEQVGTIVPGNSNFGIAGDPVGSGAYLNGQAIIDGAIVAGNDFWFQEGIVPVPEPTSLVMVGMGLFVLVKSRRRW